MSGDTQAPSRHVDFDTLLEHWLGELDDQRSQGIDLHLLGCDACGTRFDEIAALAVGVREAFGAGLVGTAVGEGFVRRLGERGLRLREYSVECNGSVNCTITPEDDVVISRLRAPLSGIAQVDLVLRGPSEPGFRAVDIPFDAASGEVVFVVPAARLRKLPNCTERMQLIAVGVDGERLIGHYTFNHRSSG